MGAVLELVPETLAVRKSAEQIIQLSDESLVIDFINPPYVPPQSIFAVTVNGLPLQEIVIPDGFLITRCHLSLAKVK